MEIAQKFTGVYSGSACLTRLLTGENYILQTQQAHRPVKQSLDSEVARSTTLRPRAGRSVSLRRASLTGGVGR
jgi:hypothetical protein